MSKLELSVSLKALDKITAPIKNIIGGTKKLTQALSDSQSKLKEINAHQLKINNLQKTQQNVEALRQRLAGAKDRQRELTQQIAATTNPTRAMANELTRVTKDVGKLTYENKKLSRTYHEQRTAAQAVGINTRQLASEKIRLATADKRLNEVIKDQEARLLRVNDAQNRLNRAHDQAAKLQAAGFRMTAMGAAITGAVGTTVKSYITFEDAMQGVAKQVDGARDSTGKLTPMYYEMADAIKNITNNIPIATEAYASLIEAQARAGIQGKENLLTMANTSASASVAFGIADAEKVGEDLGRIASLYKIPIKNIGQLGDTLNYLDDQTRSKGEDIIAVLTRLGDVASMINYRDAAALGSTFLSLGGTEETAASASRAVIRNLAIAERAPNRVQNALKEVGLSAKNITQEMSKDALGTIEKVLDAIARAPKAQQIGIATDLFGKEFGKDAMNLANNRDELNRQKALVRDPNAQGSMQREMDVKSNAISGGLQKAKNQLFNTAATLGETLRPELVATMEVFGSLIDKVNAFTKAHPQLTANIMKAVAVIGILLVIFGAIVLAISAVLVPMAALKLSWTTLFTGMGSNIKLLGLLKGGILGIGKAFLSVAGFFMTNPIALAIVAIIAVLYLLWKHWDTVKAALIAGWNWINTTFQENPILNFIFPFIGAARILINNWDAVKTHLLAIWLMIKDAAAAIWGGIKAVVCALWQGLVFYIKNMTPLGFIIDNWDKIKTYLSGLNLGTYAQKIMDTFMTPFKAGFGLLRKMWNGLNNMIPQGAQDIFNGPGGGNKTGSAPPAGKSFAPTGGSSFKPVSGLGLNKTAQSNNNSYSVVVNVPQTNASAQDIGQEVERVLAKHQRQQERNNRIQFAEG